VCDVAATALGIIRFGLGRRSGLTADVGAAELMDDLDRPAPPARITTFRTRREREAQRASLRARREELSREVVMEQVGQLSRADRRDGLSDLREDVARRIEEPVGFRQRLVDFWANHFAADTRPGRFISARAAYIDEAIRPHVAGNFAQLLRAAALHPVMLNYLSQNRSVGPFSRVGRRTGRGINENLARELLELHTLGVDGNYTQGDVTQMARLLTGITFDLDQGYKFDPRIAEPGLIEIFGKRYGGRPVKEAHVFEALDDLALRSETAAHLATKLARHFVADDPDPQLIAHMQASYLASGGALRVLYQAMLEHPAAWGTRLGKTRMPLNWIAASLRATGVKPFTIRQLSDRDTQRSLRTPLQLMGQPHEVVPSPAGYDDDATAWVTPQALAARIDWAMGLTALLPQVPDPRDFVAEAMGDMAGPALLRAARAAETRAEGVAIIIAAPDFIRC
jgi:uncharacterized protein (DUF1800 family)